ncbi:MAG TPA: NAD(P)-dependent alcohol dehydrogenase [Steroidobacteraceae bacterium]|jgi:NADPH:quinone reductase-like Zn-dependent oxidoreductase
MKRILKWIALALPVVLLAAFFVGYFRSDNECSDPGRGTPAHPVKAIVHCDYGLADVLKLENIEKPVAGEGQILVRVRAASVNPLDWHYMRGTPYVMRLSTGLRRPSEIRLGVDYAGTVEAVGPGVTRFKPGDEVFGARTGAFGEYVTAKADGSVALKPASLSFEQAAAVPVAAVTALQGLRQGGAGPGKRVLINGASGGVGTFAVQIAKAQGAHVTGVSSTRNLELVRSLGADQTIDYTKLDYTNAGVKYDMILDNVGNHGILENRRALTPEGKYVLIGGGGPDDGHWIGPMINPVKALLISPFVSQDMGMMLAELTPEDLGALAGLMQSGVVTPVIDRRYSLAQVPEAIRYLEAGHARGKVVITE